MHHPHPILLRALLTALVLGAAAGLQASESGKDHPGPTGAAEGGDLARTIAATIIHERSLELSGAGKQIVALQLDALAKGLLDGKVTLYDASLVMQLVGSPGGAGSAAGSSTLTAQAKSSVTRAESLLDGGSSAANGTTSSSATPAPAPADAPAQASGDARVDPLAGTAAAVATPKVLISDVCGVQNGDDHHVMVAAVSANSKDGLVKGEHVVFKLKGKLIAQGTVLRADDHLGFVEITKGSLVDPAQDVTEQCQAVITPTP